VKLLQPPLAAEPRDVDYFASEVWALARLNHPNCLRIFATGVDHGTAWIAMEWLARGSLADRISDRGRLHEPEVLAIGLQAAVALGAAHAAGHAHRDIEPGNLVFADAHTVKVTDFGQAALYQIAADDLGIMWGRTWYVPPERLRNEPEEAHSDIYSLGAVLFHALTGEPLHGGEPYGPLTLELLDSEEEVRVEETAGPLHQKTAEVLDRMLSSEPSRRFQHWSEVMAQLTQAGTLVARREALASQRTAPPAKPSTPAPAHVRPRAATGPWLWLAIFILILTAIGGFVAQQHRATPPHSTLQAAPQPAH